MKKDTGFHFCKLANAVFQICPIKFDRELARTRDKNNFLGNELNGLREPDKCDSVVMIPGMLGCSLEAVRKTPRSFIIDSENSQNV